MDIAEQMNCVAVILTSNGLMADSRDPVIALSCHKRKKKLITVAIVLIIKSHWALCTFTWVCLPELYFFPQLFIRLLFLPLIFSQRRERLPLAIFIMLC